VGKSTVNRLDVGLKGSADGAQIINGQIRKMAEIENSCPLPYKKINPANLEEGPWFCL
jgi:hypothetical protein